jgi:hypothetical protein
MLLIDYYQLEQDQDSVLVGRVGSVSVALVTVSLLIVIDSSATRDRESLGTTTPNFLRLALISATLPLLACEIIAKCFFGDI